MCSWEGLLHLGNEEYVVFYLLSGQDLAILIWEYLSPGGQTLAFEPGAHLSPASECQKRDEENNQLRDQNPVILAYEFQLEIQPDPSIHRKQ